MSHKYYEDVLTITRQDQSETSKMNIFRTPAARAIKSLDRSLFSKRLPTTAAAVSDNKLLSKYRKSLEKTKEIFLLDRYSPVAPHPDPALASKGQKCFVLRPEFQASGELNESLLQIMLPTKAIDSSRNMEHHDKGRSGSRGTQTHSIRSANRL